MSVQSRLIQGFSSYLSFQGISVALLGNCTPFGIFFSSVLYGALNAGSTHMQMIAKVPVPILDITQAAHHPLPGRPWDSPAGLAFAQKRTS